MFMYIYKQKYNILIPPSKLTLSAVHFLYNYKCSNSDLSFSLMVRFLCPFKIIKEIDRSQKRGQK